MLQPTGVALLSWSALPVYTTIHDISASLSDQYGGQFKWQLHEGHAEVQAIAT